MTDPNKKVSRQFQCREALWQKFEQMAKELECSVDYLINDAMKQYARQRGYGATTTMGPTGPSMVGAPPPPAPPSSSPAHVAPPPPPMAAPPLPPALSNSAGPPPLPPSASVSPTVGLPPPPGTMRPTPPPKRGAGPPPPPPPPPGVRRGAPPPLAPPRSLPPTGAGARPASGGSGALTIHYQGEVFPVTKERFIIGRGKQTSDLTIKDPNVSRQHAMIEFSNGQYYIVDMGSTNGVEFNGQRIQRRSIGEGDIYKVCDHELRFSFH